MIRRDGKVLIPNGSVELLKDDTVFIYSKKNIADAQTVKV
jgi:Trk K+ transport system NAD-binding subunit